MKKMKMMGPMMMMIGAKVMMLLPLLILGTKLLAIKALVIAKIALILALVGSAGSLGSLFSKVSIKNLLYCYTWHWTISSFTLLWEVDTKHDNTISVFFYLLKPKFRAAAEVVHRAAVAVGLLVMPQVGQVVGHLVAGDRTGDPCPMMHLFW